MRMLLTIHFKRSAHSLKSNIAESASATKTIQMDSLMSFSADQSILGMRLKPVFDPVRGDVPSQMRAPVSAGVAAIAPPPTGTRCERNNATNLQSLRHHSAIFAAARQAASAIGAVAAPSRPRGRHPGTRPQGRAVRPHAGLARGRLHAVGCRCRYLQRLKIATAWPTSCRWAHHR